jgi:hypothetical protein
MNFGNGMPEGIGLVKISTRITKIASQNKVRNYTSLKCSIFIIIVKDFSYPFFEKYTIYTAILLWQLMIVRLFYELGIQLPQLFLLLLHEHCSGLKRH